MADLPAHLEQRRKLEGLEGASPGRLQSELVLLGTEGVSQWNALRKAQGSHI